jgi:hypothetical protein
MFIRRQINEMEFIRRQINNLPKQRNDLPNSQIYTFFSSFYNNSSVEFIRRQINEVAHRLAKTTSYIYPIVLNTS